MLDIPVMRSWLREIRNSKLLLLPEKLAVRICKCVCKCYRQLVWVSELGERGKREKEKK